VLLGILVSRISFTLNSWQCIMVCGWELGILNLVCYLVSKSAIKLISETVNDWHHYALNVWNIQELISRNWQVHLLHTHREGNACTDYIAKLGAGSHEPFWSIEQPLAGC